MSENLQLNLFGNEQDLKKSPSYQGGSLANLTALQDSVNRLVMSVTSGQSTGESLAKLNRDGSWLKMFGGCSQVKMDGSFWEFSETCPSWGLVLDGVLIQPLGLEPYIDESEFSLLPTPTASDGQAYIKKSQTNTKMSIWKGWLKKKQDRPINHFMWNGLSINQSAEIYEMIMGFPKEWTDLNASETQ
mgnify:CR=1 FL=1